MKKSLLVIFIAMLSAHAIAQTTGGIKAGINIATFTGDDASGSDARVGYHAGGYLTVPATEKILFQPELLINSVGAKYEESGVDPDFGDYSIKGTIMLTYISAPITFLINLNEKINLQVGPQISFLTAAKVKYDFESAFGNFSGSEGVKDQYKTMDFGVNFGLGVNFGVINACARYSLGLAEIPEESANLKNGVVQFSLGYKISNK